MKNSARKMLTLIKNHLSTISIYIIFILCSYYIIQWRWIGCVGDSWKTIINSDGRGYYAYLPAIFIDGNFTYQSKKKYDKEILKNNPNHFLDKHGNVEVNRCFAGVALLLTPFFILAWFASNIFHYPVDGYSLPFQLSVSLGALFYLIAGLFSLRKFLLLSGIKDFIVAAILILQVFATNLFHSLVNEPSMTHVYSFSMVCVFLNNCTKLFHQNKIGKIVLIFISLGLLVLLRPTNGLIGLLFLLPAENFRQIPETLKRIFNKPRLFVIGLLFFFSIVFTQLLLYYGQSGNLFLWPYTNEGFDFQNPQVLNVLFSYKKGLFLWTPIILLSLPGIIVLLKRNKFQFYLILIWLLLTLYVVSSWHAWSYGNSFGMRAFIEYYPLFIFLLSLVLSSLQKRLILFFIYLSLCVATAFLNIIQTNQYRLGILLPDQMSKESYWDVFLKTDGRYVGYLEWRHLPHPQTQPVAKNCKLANYNFDIDTPLKSKAITTEKFHSGPNSIKVFKEFCYGPGLSSNDSLLTKDEVVVSVNGWINIMDINSTAIVAFSLEDKNKIYSWQSVRLSPFIDKTNQWTWFEVSRVISPAKNHDDALKVYIMNDSRYPVYVDDFTVSFCPRTGR